MKLLDNHRKWTMPERKMRTKPRTVSAVSPSTLTRRKDPPDKTDVILHGHLLLPGVPGCPCPAFGCVAPEKGEIVYLK